MISSGKFRRYANLKWWYRWFSFYHITRTHIPNLIDGFKITAGFFQSVAKLILWRPDVIFCKGGYVCLPVGVSAHLLRIPLVIHDSDTVPGLTNRVLARYATFIGTGAPVDNYPNYPAKRTKFIGIPVRKEIKPASAKKRLDIKRRLGLSPDNALILAMGGGLGSVDINRAIVARADDMNDQGIDIVLLKGRGRHVLISQNYNHTNNRHAKGKIIIKDFLDNVSEVEAAADIVVTRAGATTMAELATVGAATIIIPSPYLAGDHQTKNAKVYSEQNAALVINQFELNKNPTILSNQIERLVADGKRRKQLGDNLSKFARPNALDDMVNMILNAVK